MFDKYIICENGFRNIQDGKKVTGFQLRTRLPYYRGLGLSMVEDLTIKVDDEVVQRSAVRVTLHGNTYTLDQMETEFEDRWEFGEEGLISVDQEGGLSSGIHHVEVLPSLRISYLPFILVGQDSKNLVLES